MEKKSTTQKRYYRITVILKDEIVTDKFYRKDVAIDTIIGLKKLFPEMFIGGALEERRNKWELIWTLDRNEMPHVEKEMIQL